MATEIKVWGKGRKGLWSFNNSVDIPEDYVEVEPGDPYVTRHIKLRSEVVYCRMKKAKRLGFSKIIGILAPPQIVEEVLADAKQTKAMRKVSRAKAAIYRSSKESERNQQRIELLKQKLPSMPDDDAYEIVERAFEVGSGRVGRTSSLSDDEKLHAATIAHIRHCHTGYEAMLEQGIEREEARECVAGKIQRLFHDWEKPAAQSPATEAENLGGQAANTE